MGAPFKLLPLSVVAQPTATRQSCLCSRERGIAMYLFIAVQVFNLLSASYLTNLQCIYVFNQYEVILEI